MWPPGTAVPFAKVVLRLCVTMIAPGGDLLTTDPRIKGVVGPFYFRFFGHVINPNT